MADYFVLEEDGTSHLELEESTNDFLLEDGIQTFFGAAELQISLDVSTGGATPSTTYATWKVGTITVPGSTGSMAITELGGTPAAVFFYGTNWLTEDTAVTTTGAGLFRGMAAPKWDDAGTIVQNAACVIPPGDAHAIDDHAVHQLTTGGGTSTLYLADLTSFDADGFTLDWTVAASGGYKVVYAALMDVADIGGYVGGSATLSLGWKVGSALMQGAWAGPIASGGDRTQEFYGGAAYPHTGWYAAGLTAYTFPTSAGAQYNIGIYDQAPTTLVAQGGHFSGPFLITSDQTLFPTGSGLTDFDINFDADNGGMVVVWDDEDNRTGRLTPGASTGNTQTVSGLPFSPGLVIGYSISNQQPGQGTGGLGAAGFSVITPDFQWTALVNGVSSYGAYQSFQRGLCATVSGTSVHTATVELTGDGFVVTTDDDDISPASWVWHAFGHPTLVSSWIPQIRRWMVGP